MQIRTRGTLEDQETFVLSFLEHSDREREAYRSIDREVLENYMMLPSGGNYASGSSQAMLKDSETLVMVDTLLADFLLRVLNPRGFIEAQPVGREDAPAAKVMSKLLERTMRGRGNFLANYLWAKDMALFGTSILAPSWEFELGTRPRREVGIDLFGNEFTSTYQAELPIKDGVRLECVDLDDFFGDPGNQEIERMTGAARRYTVSRQKAASMGEQKLADGSTRWIKERVNRAIHSQEPQSSHNNTDRDDSWRQDIDRLGEQKSHADYGVMIAYEWWGELPFDPRDGQGRHRRITILNGVLVESRPSPLSVLRKIPFYELSINPIQGRFRGIAPGAVARYTQDFKDALLICLASSVVRKTNPPVIFNRTQRVDVNALRNWKGPIGALSVDAVKDLPYNPPIGDAFAMLQFMTQSQREGSGASDPIAGRGFGSKRLSASEASLIAEGAASRPQLTAELAEREYLPALAQGIVEILQQFIEGTEDLVRRVGTDVEPVPIERIQTEFDLKFTGSSKIASQELQLQFLERAMSIAGSIPGAAPNFPWAPAFAKYLEMMDLRDLENMVANPSGVEDFLLNSLAQSSGGSGNGNGAIQGGSIPGLAPAQASGLAP